jgi:hypothetical protein
VVTGERHLFVIIVVDGLPELLAWVAAGTPGQREQRAAFAKECIAEALAGVDADEVNRQIRAALQPDPFATLKSAATSSLEELSLNGPPNFPPHPRRAGEDRARRALQGD